MEKKLSKDISAVEFEIIPLEADETARFEALANCISPEDFSEARRRGA